MATMTQNEWAILEGSSFTVLPGSTDGSVSFTAAWAGDDLCGSNPWWSCAPADLQVGQVQTGWSHNFGEGWFDLVNMGSVTQPVQIATDYLTHLYFRVTSGTVQIAANTPIDVAPVPLPAAGVLLPLAMVAMVAFKRARR